MSSAPPAPDDQIVTLDLDESGSFIEFTSKKKIRLELLADRLKRLVPVDPDVTDIFIYVHGWQNASDRASNSVGMLAKMLRDQVAGKGRYPGLRNFKPLYVLIRWPSKSNPFPWGYRRIRDRAHAMTTDGHAEFVIAHILGYFNSVREPPSAVAPGAADQWRPVPALRRALLRRPVPVRGDHGGGQSRRADPGLAVDR